MNKVAKSLAAVVLLTGLAACNTVDEKARADAASAMTTAQNAANAAQAAADKAAQAAASAQAAADKVERVFNKSLRK